MLILPPQHKSEWRQPSQRSSIHGLENLTRFRLTARTNDGHIVWRGWFDDRDDADAFLYSLISGSLYYEKDLWRLPNPWWPGLDPHLVYDFVTNRTLLTTSASNQTDSVPSDWDSASNTIEVIASGGSGGASSNENRCATGGGGAGYSKATNTILIQNGTATFRLSAGGVAVSASGGFTTNGNAGADAWYNGTTLAGSSVGAKAGSGGAAGILAQSGGAGGSSASGIGNSTKTSGGTGGTAINTNDATGGGGAGGINGNGVDGTAAVGADTGTAGGAGDNGSGGAGGSGGTNANGGVGGNGTEFGSTGSGGGGGGGIRTTGSAVNGGIGGNYGAGGGGSSTNAALSTSGDGSQAIIFITYTPYIYINVPFPQIPPRYLSRIRMVGY